MPPAGVFEADNPSKVRGFETMMFGRLDIGFDSRVLRPRPWTVSQSEWASQLLYDLPAGPVLELCAGVGHIGLLALSEHDRDLVLVDMNEAACEHARSNAAAAGLAGQVSIRHARIEEALGPQERFAFVIADPPWVRSDLTGQFPDDPLTAIDGGPGGLAIAWICLQAMATHVVDDGAALLQLGTPEQVDAVRDRLPEFDLRIAEVRDFGNRGVLVHLTRGSAR